MPYLYETHLHTCEASACGIAHGRDYIPVYQDMGYQGIFVTDHFFGGNTAVNRTLPWHDQVDAFCEGYEQAKAEGDRRGFQVLFGWEQGYDGDEYLVYGLTRAWLYEHPEVKRWTRAEQYTEAHRYGGCVVQAHPFRDRSYIHRIYLNTVCVDGAEVYNAANSLETNALAYRYARNLGLATLAGSDVHSLPWREYTGVSLPTPLINEQDFAARVRARQPITPQMPVSELTRVFLADARTAGAPTPGVPIAKVTLPVTVLGDNARPVDVSLGQLLR